MILLFRLLSSLPLVWLHRFGVLLGWLGWPQFIIGSFAAFFIGGAISLVLLASKKVDLHGGIPFGPSMLLGAWLGIFAGVPIATLYLQLTGLA